MILPISVTQCIAALEEKGHAAWAVGGCVRDDLLGIPPHDFDLCTSALPEETEAVFSGHSLVLAGKKHGTVGVVTDSGVIEITTFRTEGGYEDGRHPDWVHFVSQVEEDLARRDFTINAMAYSPTRGLADPFGGREDLQTKILRAVGEPERRFPEDPLRILRGVRFAVRFGLSVEPETEKAMFSLAPLMEGLSRERVYEELCGLLPLAGVRDLQKFGPILASVIPELAPMLDFDQRSPHHAYDLFTHTAHVVAAVPGDLTIRWAALLHDVGKVPCFTTDENGRGHFYGHAPKGAELADGILRRLKAPNALREEAVLLIKHHMTRLDPNKKLLRRQVARFGWDTIYALIALQEADMVSKGTEKPKADHFQKLRRSLAEIREENSCLTLKELAVDGYDLMALGLKGKAIGQTLTALLDQVLDETLPNEKNSLLNHVRSHLL